jgi:hypothetical protein
VTPVPPPVVAGAGPVPQPVPEPVLEPLPELVPPTSGEAPPPASDAGLPAAPTVPAATEPATVPVQAVAPARTTVVWREVARPGEAVTFEPLIRGVLGRSAGGYHDEDDSGALVLRPEIEAPAAPVLGIWPDNAWFIETRVKIEKGDRSMTELRQLRLMRLRGKRRWVPQAYNGEQRFEDDGERFQIGGTGGLIVESRGSLTRLADNAVDPVMGLDIGGELVAFFETKSGRVYPVRSKDGALHVQRDCADLECVATEAIRLPARDPVELHAAGHAPAAQHLQRRRGSHRRGRPGPSPALRGRRLEARVAHGRADGPVAHEGRRVVGDGRRAALAPRSERRVA